MKQNDYSIRLEAEADYRETEALVRESFWNVYRPGCTEHYILHVLRDDPAYLPELALVMEKDGRLIGQTAYVQSALCADDGRRVPILTLGPIGILPGFRRQGYGRILLEASLEKAASLGWGAVCLEGNIRLCFFVHDFYPLCPGPHLMNLEGRYCGLPDGADDSFFLLKELIPGYLEGITGVYAPPQVYFVQKADADAFDAAFPPKERLRLPGQLFGGDE